MGQTSRFLNELHQEQDALASSEKEIHDMLVNMHPGDVVIASVMNQFQALSRQASQVCESVWLDVEPERGKHESEVLVKISRHISMILLSEWQKWLYKKSDA